MAARIVGKDGKAIGIDFTDAMIEEAQSVAEKEGLSQVELVKAPIDNVPLPNNIADFIISNCVINLTFNKQKVFDEAFRLLKPGGMLIDADVISDRPLSKDIQSNDELWCSCVGGALTSDEYSKKIKKWRSYAPFFILVNIPIRALVSKSEIRLPSPTNFMHPSILP
jgi:ubiquinone/menaquinone biosynthesis C-methylase UbiE